MPAVLSKLAMMAKIATACANHEAFDQTFGAAIDTFHDFAKSPQKMGCRLYIQRILADHNANYYRKEVLHHVLPSWKEELGGGKDMTFADWVRFGRQYDDPNPSGTMVYCCIAVDHMREHISLYVGKTIAPVERRKAHTVQKNRRRLSDKRFYRIVDEDPENPLEVFFVPIWRVEPNIKCYSATVFFIESLFTYALGARGGSHRILTKGCSVWACLLGGRAIPEPLRGNNSDPLGELKEDDPRYYLTPEEYTAWKTAQKVYRRNMLKSEWLRDPTSYYGQLHGRTAGTRSSYGTTPQDVLDFTWQVLSAQGHEDYLDMPDEKYIEQYRVYPPRKLVPAALYHFIEVARRRFQESRGLTQADLVLLSKYGSTNASDVGKIEIQPKAHSTLSPVEDRVRKNMLNYIKSEQVDLDLVGPEFVALCQAQCRVKRNTAKGLMSKGADLDLVGPTFVDQLTQLPEQVAAMRAAKGRVRRSHRDGRESKQADLEFVGPEFIASVKEPSEEPSKQPVEKPSEQDVALTAAQRRVRKNTTQGWTCKKSDLDLVGPEFIAALGNPLEQEVALTAAQRRVRKNTKEGRTSKKSDLDLVGQLFIASLDRPSEETTALWRAQRRVRDNVISGGVSKQADLDLVGPEFLASIAHTSRASKKRKADALEQ